MKSHRFGCAFEDTLTRSAERLEVLLLIHMLATLAAWLAALAAIARHEYRFRISLLRHGWESLRSGGGVSNRQVAHSPSSGGSPSS